MLSSGFVHVFDEAAGACRPALVIYVATAAPGKQPQAYLRVIQRTGLGGSPGDDDQEGWYPHADDAPVYGSGSEHERHGDSWHAVDWLGSFNGMPERIRISHLAMYRP